MPVAEEVIVELTAKIAEYKKSLTEASSHFDRNASHIEGRSKLMSERVRLHFGALTLWSSAALAGVPILLGHMIDKSFELAASLKEQAQQVGVTASALQEYRYAASQVGLSSETVTRGLQFLTRNFGLAEQGAKKPLKALKDLGFTTAEMSRIIQMDAGTALPMIAEKFTKLKTPADQARVAIGLMGRSGQQMVPLLLQGAAGIDRLRAAAEQMGGVLNDTEIEHLHQAEIRYNALKTILSARIAGAVADNADAILGLVSALIKLANILSRIPQLWDQAMAKIATAELPIEQAMLKASQAGGGAGLHGDGGDTFIQKQLKIAIAGDQRRIASVPFQIPGARSVKLRLPGMDDSIEAGGDDLSGVINKALTPKGEKGPKGESAAETLKRYLDEEISLQQRLNTAKAATLHTVEAKLQAELANSRLQDEEDIRHIQNDKYYSEAQKKALIAKVKEAGIDERATLIAEKLNQDRQDELGLQAAHLSNERDILSAEEQLVTDRKERAAIEKKLLDLALAQERIDAQKVLDDRNATPAAQQAARDRLAILPIAQAYGYANINMQNASPGQKYLKDLQDGIRDVDDQIQNMEIDNLKKLEDFLAGSVAKTLHLSGALGDVVTQLIRIGLQRTLIEPIANLLFGGGAAGGSGIMSLLGKLLGIGASVPGFSQGTQLPIDLGGGESLFRASGGPVRGGGGYMVGEQGPEWFQPGQSGMIVPNGALKAGGGAGAGGVVTVQIMAGEHFDARVAGVAGPVAARIIYSAAPHVTDLAAAKTANRMTRPRL